MNDPTGVIAALSLIPGVGPYLIYLPLLWLACKVVIFVWPAPASGSRLVGLYNLVSKLALNFGRNANAVVAGMPAEVQSAASEAAKMVAAAPDQAVIAGTIPVQVPVIAATGPASSAPMQNTEGKKP